MTIEYKRGIITEQYLAKTDKIEQRFVIESPLPTIGADLTIGGLVNCEAIFEQTKKGWLWKNDLGAIELGKVYVFDASGISLPAKMKVTST